MDECFVAGGRLGGWAVKFGPRVKCGSPDCHLLPRDHPKQQQQQPLLQQQLQQLQLQQPRQQQLQRRQPLNMEEGKTGLTTLTTNTGDLAKKNNTLEYAWQLHERASVKMENYLCLVLNCFFIEMRNRCGWWKNWR